MISAQNFGAERIDQKTTATASMLDLDLHLRTRARRGIDSHLLS
jgi:hypothetical protein